MSLVGMGYRHEIGPFIQSNVPPLEALEVTVDHFILGGREQRDAISGLRELCPVVAHGVGLSVGTAEPPDPDYLDAVAEVLGLLEAPWHSEHLAFTKDSERDLAQLLPLPRTREVLGVVCDNISRVQDHLRMPLVLENITYYFEYPDSQMSELEFLSEVHHRSGAFLLIDLENVHVNALNHGRYDPLDFVDGLPQGSVKSVHVAGGGEEEGLSIDTHDAPVPQRVFDLLERLLVRHRPDVLILERDQGLHGFSEILDDVEKVRAIRNRYYPVDRAAAHSP